MGYSTDFVGTLKFKEEVTASQLAKLTELLEDAEDIYIDLEITKDFTGVQWDGTEKTSGMCEAVNFLIKEMKKKFPDFGLKGKLNAQGEDVMDRWSLVIKDDKAMEVHKEIECTTLHCPHCEEDVETVLCGECEQEFPLIKE